MKITKLNYNGRNIYENTAIATLNEVIDTINDHKQQLSNHLCRILALEDPDEPEQTDPYAEQRKWIGCVCRFWFDNPDNTVLDYLGKIQTGENGIEYYGKETYDWFPHCEPVKPDDDIIFKGEQDEY